MLLPSPPRPLPPKWLRRCLLKYVLLGVGCGLLVIGAGVGGLMIQTWPRPEQRTLFESGKRVDALIAELKGEPPALSIDYEFKQGERTLRRSNVLLPRGSMLKKGDSVTVAFDPDKPEKSWMIGEIAPHPLLEIKLAIVFFGIGALVIGSNLYSLRKDLRYFSHGIEVHADCEEEPGEGKKTTYKLTYIWDGREYWKKEKVKKGLPIVRDEVGRAVLVMEPGKADHATLVTRQMYDVEPPPPPPSEDKPPKEDESDARSKKKRRR